MFVLLLLLTNVPDVNWKRVPGGRSSNKTHEDIFNRMLQRNKQAVWVAATICLRPCKLTFDLLTVKVVSESRVTWATSVPILVFLGLSVLELGPMYTTDRQDRRQTCIIA